MACYAIIKTVYSERKYPFLFNEILWISFAIINFIIVLFFFKRFGKTGLFVWIGFATAAANIEVVKTVEPVRFDCDARQHPVRKRVFCDRRHQ